MKKICSFLLVCFAVLSSFAQTETIKAKAFVANNAVLLRWIPLNVETFTAAVKYGYTIQRVTVTDSLSPLVFEKKLTPIPVNPIPSGDSAWNKLFANNNSAAFVYSVLYPALVKNTVATTEKKKDEQMNFGFFLLSCDLSVELANAAGFYYKDTSEIQGGKYVYRISIENAAQQPLKIYTDIFVDATIKSNLPPITDLRGDYSDKCVMLTWNAVHYKNHYAAYNIERSSDSLHFVKVNTTPFVQLTSQFEKNKEYAHYTDTLPDNETYYYYRIKGISHFGLESASGNTIKGKGKNKFASYPVIDTIYSVDNKKVEIKWKIPNESDLSHLKGYFIARATAENGNYVIINSSVVLTPFYTDTTPLFTNYYKILAINKDRDTSVSHSALIQLADNEPPKSPKGLYGVVDEKGVVKLNWMANNEKDLKGYRIFRCNSVNEEPVEVAEHIIADTFFIDTITINTLTKSVYYTLTAVDSFFNNSPYSNYTKLKRPDFIKPVAPLFTSAVIRDSCIYLNWILSSSEDVLKYVLIREETGSNRTDTLLTFLLIDTINNYEDKKVVYEESYVYALIVFDDAGNFSIASSLPVKYEPGSRPAVDKITGVAKYDLKCIDLKWNYDFNNIYSYVIYKAKKGEPFRIYKTIIPAINTFTDKHVNPNNTYLYKIKAIHNNGAESRLSEAIEVIY